MAIASIQSAATFPDPNVKYVFRTENGGQVREGASCLQVLPGVGVEGGNERIRGRPGLEEAVTTGMPAGLGGGAGRRRFGVDPSGVEARPKPLGTEGGMAEALSLKHSYFGALS